MFRRIAIVLPLLTALVSPAKEPPPPPAAPVTGTVIEIYRPGRFMCSADYIPVIIDDKEVGRIQQGRYLTVRVAPGTHTVRGDETPPTQVEVKADATAFVRFRYDHIGCCCQHDLVVVLAMAPDEAQREVAGLKPSETKYIYATEVAPAPAPVAPAPAPAPAAPQTATLDITSGASVQVYIDDEFKGTTSDEGHLVVTLPPGTHKVRLSQPGKKQWAEPVTLVAGQRYPIATQLESAGPKPLTEAEIEEALNNGVPKPRVRSLVQEYGVNFDLGNGAEERLRKAGADDDLILTIVKNKK